jgi:phosphohistidine phosphatase SixA
MQQQLLQRSHLSTISPSPLCHQHQQLLLAATRSGPNYSRRLLRLQAGHGVATAEHTLAKKGSAVKVRRMILLRHADSETSSTLRDYDRPISMQGRREASNIAKRLCELGWIPDLIIASNSKRTKQTLDQMAEAAAELSTVDAHYLGSLYTVAALDGQTKQHIEETIRSVACDAKNFCIMCVGHNKGWEEAASAFANQAVRLGTASAALFELANSSWDDVTSPDTEWRLVEVVTP